MIREPFGQDCDIDLYEQFRTAFAKLKVAKDALKHEGENKDFVVFIKAELELYQSRFLHEVGMTYRSGVASAELIENIMHHATIGKVLEIEDLKGGNDNDMFPDE